MQGAAAVLQINGWRKTAGEGEKKAEAEIEDGIMALSASLSELVCLLELLFINTTFALVLMVCLTAC